MDVLWKPRTRKLVFICIAVPVFVYNLLVIVYLERTLTKNRDLMTDQTQEWKWTFGQLIAIFLLAPSAISIVKMWRCSLGPGGVARKGTPDQIEQRGTDDRPHELVV